MGRLLRAPSLDPDGRGNHASVSPPVRYW